MVNNALYNHKLVHSVLLLCCCWSVVLWRTKDNYKLVVVSERVAKLLIVSVCLLTHHISVYLKTLQCNIIFDFAK